MIVTVITDASHDFPTKVGAWGAWVKSGRGSVESAGAFKSSMGSSTVAEICAGICGIYLGVSRRLLIPEEDSVLLEIDNSAALKWLDPDYKVKRSVIKDADKGVITKALNLRDALMDRGMGLELRHIKAHSGTSTPRTWVHSRCDLSAKAAMRIKRDFK